MINFAPCSENPISPALVRVSQDEFPPLTYSASEVVDAVIREQSRAQRLYHYLNAAMREGSLTSHTANLAWAIWNHLSEITLNCLAVPDACPGSQGQILYTWDKDEHHLELEVFPNSPAEFFYRNRIFGQLWEADYQADAPLSEEVSDKLALFLKP